MPDPSTSVWLGVPGYVYLWVLALVSFFLFARKVWEYGAVLRGARPETRWDRPGERARLFAVNVLGQRRLFQEPVIGAAHFIIFWAFVFYAAGFFWNLVRGLFPFLPIPYADEVRWMAFVLVLFGVLGFAALVVAAVRRYVFAPPRLEQSRDAAVILGLIALVLVSMLAGQAFRARAPGLALAMWWLHMITVLAFLAYLPYSKHLHLLASPFGVFFASLQPGRLPAPSEGASRREEFTWRQLFSGLACAECGRCDRVCPAFTSGYPLSPKMLMHHVKELVRTPSPDGSAVFVGDVIKQEEIWACTTCFACMKRCPVYNEHVPLLIEMRRYLISNGDVDPRLQQTLTNLTRYGNCFGVSPRSRARWTQELGFPIKDARAEPVHYLWFVGDYASFDPRVAPATRATARLLQRAGVDFGILYDAEQNAGNDARLVGESGLYDMLVGKNRKALEKARFEQIFTTDPHSYHVLKNDYAAGNVLHHSELLETLLRAGRLVPLRALDFEVTYHDPCYLGRYNGIFSAPRNVLRELGATVAEMPRNRDGAYCCGAGGGRIWMEDTVRVQERPAESRVREAARLPEVQTLVVSCPKDLVMFQDAVKTTGLDKTLAIRDLSEVVEQATG